MIYQLIKMSFKTPLHIGLGKDNYDSSSNELHADTLTAALAAVRAMNGKTEDIEAFLQSFTLSSAFPFHQDEYFLPKPIGRIPVQVRNQEEAAYRKGLKGIRFIENGLWKKMMSGEQLCIEPNQIQGHFLCQGQPDFEKPFTHQVSQRVTVSRNEEDEAQPFFFDWTYFNEGCGLYCLTDAQGDLLDELLMLFSQLGENGIGSDRNVGGGHFTVSTAEMEFQPVDGADQLMLLSPYVPTPEEHRQLDWQQSKFALVDRGGYMAGSNNESIRHLWKRSVYMLDEGSVLKGLNRIEGKVVDLTPTETTEVNSSHPVYRSGRPLYLPVKMNKI